MKAISRSLRIAPRKLNLIAGLIRNKNAVEAMNILSFTPKKGAKILHKVVKSAVANAENNFKQSPATLYIKEVVVTKAPTMKRGVPVSRGRVNPVLKRNAHVMVSVGVMENAPKAEKKKSKAPVSKAKTITATPKAKKSAQ